MQAGEVDSLPISPSNWVDAPPPQIAPAASCLNGDPLPFMRVNTRIIWTYTCFDLDGTPPRQRERLAIQNSPYTEPKALHNARVRDPR